MKTLYSLRQIQFAYTNKPVLDIDQLDIFSNKVTAVFGSNGAGKSTFLKVLSLLEIPQQGHIQFYGKELSTFSPVAFRRRVIFVDQKPYLLHGTVMDNVILGLKFRGINLEQSKKEVLKALDKVGILSFANRPVTDLSGGEAQKVALARALVLKPEVLLLDEPFTHLDQASIKQFTKLIKNFVNQDDCSVIFSTHEKMYADAIADEKIFLELGKVVSG